MLDAPAYTPLCRQLGLTSETQAMIAIIQASPPTRRVHSAAGNVSVRYPSQKMGVTIQAESHRNELAALYLMEHDPHTLAYYDQPPGITLTYRAQSGRSVVVKHTPDFFVIRTNGIGWEEWKMEDDLPRLAARMPNRYHQDATGQWHCPPGEQYAAQFGLTYHVRSSREINWVVQRNLHFLEDYWRVPLTNLDPVWVTNVRTTIVNEPGITLAALVAHTGSQHTDLLFALIASEQVYIDFAAAPLVEPHSVHVFLDHTTAHAYTRLMTAKASPQPVPTSISLTVGNRLVWDNVAWQIVNVGDQHITLLNGHGDVTTLPHTTATTLVQENTITNGASWQGPALHPTARELLASAHPDDWAEANRRYILLRPLLEKEPLRDSATPARTLRSWLTRYRQAEEDLGCGYVGLLPLRWRRGNRTPRLSDKTRTLMEEALSNIYETPEQCNIRTAYGACVLACQTEGVQSPSYKTFAKALHARPQAAQVARRHGHRAAYQEQPFFWELVWTTPRHGDRPFEIGHIDHTELDVLLVCSRTGRVLGRPWLTLLLDAYTRRILALFLSFDPPSYRSCMMLLRIAVQRHGRLPQTVVVDGGSEFASVYFETLLARYACTHKTRPYAAPRFGSVIERLFNTANTVFIHTLCGNTQALRVPRQLTHAVDPQQQARWTFDQLLTQLSTWAYEIYDITDHPALGQSPRDAFTKGITQHGWRNQCLIPYDEDFRMATLPTTKRGTATVHPQHGVKIHYVNYWADAFRHPDVIKTAVPVRYDPFDAGVAYAFVKGRWVQCVSEYYARFKGRSERELLIATTELRKQHQQHQQSFTVTAARLAAFLASAQADVLLADQRNRDAELHNALHHTLPNVSFPHARDVSDGITTLQEIGNQPRHTHTTVAEANDIIYEDY